MSRKWTHGEQIEKFNETANSEFIDVVGIYKNAKTPIECYCKKHDQYFYPIFSNLLKGVGCKKCGIEKALRTRKYCKANNLKLIELHYWEIKNTSKIITKELNLIIEGEVAA